MLNKNRIKNPSLSFDWQNSGTTVLISLISVAIGIQPMWVVKICEGSDPDVVVDFTGLFLIMSEYRSPTLATVLSADAANVAALSSILLFRLARAVFLIGHPP